jgi:hypothetical protein
MVILGTPNVYKLRTPARRGGHRLNHQVCSPSFLIWCVSASATVTLAFDIGVVELLSVSLSPSPCLSVSSPPPLGDNSVLATSALATTLGDSNRGAQPSTPHDVSDVSSSKSR